MEQDWRLNSQEKHLQNAVLFRVVFPAFWETAFSQKNTFYQNILRYAKRHVEKFPDKKEYLEGDKIQFFWHEHCDFCWEKAMTNIEATFYCTWDMRHWICQECFEDFQNKFGWNVKSSDEMFN